jgi:hypothetical protein
LASPTFGLFKNYFGFGTFGRRDSLSELIVAGRKSLSASTQCAGGGL